MKIIKLIMALGIFICLFLPLSQCSPLVSKLASSSKENVQQKVSADNLVDETTKEDNIIIRNFDDVIDINNTISIISFTLPLLFCISLSMRKWNIVKLILQTLNHCWLIFLTWMSVWFLFVPLWGGYLLTFFVVVYALITIVEWINFFRKKQLA